MFIEYLPSVQTAVYEPCEVFLSAFCGFYGPACNGAVLEALIVAGSCIFFLLLSRKQGLQQKWNSKGAGEKSSKLMEGNGRAAKSRKYQTGNGRDGAKYQSDGKKPDKMYEMNSTKARGGAGRTFKHALHSLERYKAMVWQQGANLNEKFSEQQARFFYVNLIGCMIQVTNANLPSTPGGTQGEPNAMCGWIHRILADMRKFGFKQNVESYCSMMKCFANDNLWKEVLAFHSEMKTDEVEPDQAVLINLMNAAVATDDHYWAFRYFRHLAQLTPPSQRTYMTVLRIYGRRKDWEGAIKLVGEMESLGSRPDNLVINQVLGLCVACNQLGAAETLLSQWTGVVDVISYNTVLKGHTAAGEMKAAEQMLDNMIKNGPAPNLITFNTMMDCAYRALQSLEHRGRGQDSSSKAYRAMREVAEKPWKLLDLLIEIGLMPDRYTCSTIVKGMHLSGGSPEELDRALALLRLIGADNLKCAAVVPNQPASITQREGNTRLVEVIFNTLLDICSSGHDIDRMIVIFQLMREFEVDISAVTFGTLIKAFGQALRLPRCHEVWQQMRDSGIAPTVVTYGCYIDACIRNKDIVTAEKMFESMPENRIKPNAVIYTSLIRGLASAGQPGRAFALYRHMRAAGVEPTSVTFNSVLDMVARRLADPENLREVLNDMNSVMGNDKDATAYCILIKASCNSGNLHNAITLYKQLRGQGIIFDHGTFNVILLTCGKADKMTEVDLIFKDMLELNFMPTTAATSIIIKMYGRLRQPNKAFEVFEAVDRVTRIEKGNGERPNLHVYTCLIQACVQNKQVKKSWQVFDWMLHENFEPDAVSYDTLINGCIYANKFEHAMTLVRHANMLAPKCHHIPSQDTPIMALEQVRLKKKLDLSADILLNLKQAMSRKDQNHLVEELATISGC